MTPLHRIPARYWLAMIIVPFALALMVLSVRLSEQRSHEAAEKAEIAATAKALRKDREVLTELCKTQAIIEGLVAGTTTLFKYEIGLLPPYGFRGPNPPPRPVLINPKLVPAYRNALNTFLGWEVELGNAIACERIAKP